MLLKPGAMGHWARRWKFYQMLLSQFGSGSRMVSYVKQHTYQRLYSVKQVNNGTVKGKLANVIQKMCDKVSSVDY